MFFTHLLIPYAFFRALPNPLVSNFKMYHKFNPSLLSFPSWPSAISSHQLCLILFSPQTFCSPEAVQVIFFLIVFWFLVVKNPPANAGDMRRGFSPRFGKTSWRRAWHFTPVFLPGESHRQKSLVGYSPYSHTEPDTTEET